MRKYECANCRGTFDLVDDGTAEAEFAALYPGMDVKDTDLICDDCFKKFNEWMASRQESN